MNRKTFPATAPKFAALNTLALAIQNEGPQGALQALQALQNNPLFSGPAWQASFAKLERVMTTKTPHFSIFALKGNEKLPFVSFSTLPGATCPGAGDCLDFCYSFRAWRYPAAFCRMAQNAYLMRANKGPIIDAFRTIADSSPEGFDFRLYVDGDFSSVSDVAFWMQLLEVNPHVRAYGYSKSFAQLVTYGRTYNWPANYQLNLSSGHNAAPDMLGKAKGLPITRGEFIAVSIGHKAKAIEHGTKETNKALRAAYGAKAFPCPGACGSCTGKGHACGMPQLKGLPIIIAIH